MIHIVIHYNQHSLRLRTLLLLQLNAKFGRVSRCFMRPLSKPKDPQTSLTQDLPLKIHLARTMISILHRGALQDLLSQVKNKW
jgi:hypothetical protein